MSDVLVTGGLGGLGSWTVEYLNKNGYDVISVDMRTPRNSTPEIDFLAADLTDYGETREIIESFDPDTVVHMAAIPDPEHHADSHVFENNVISSYNVLDAAGNAGSDIVWASSVALYGLDFAAEPWVPNKIPITEQTDRVIQDAYGLSKEVGESIAERIVNRYDTSVVSVRPPWIEYPGEYKTERIRREFDLETAQPTDSSSKLLWAYVDVRDVVQLVENAISSRISGHEPFLCAAEDNFIGVDTKKAIQSVFSEIPEQCLIDGDESVYSCSKAEDMLDWTPRHTWKTAESESISGPEFV